MERWTSPALIVRLLGFWCYSPVLLQVTGLEKIENSLEHRPENALEIEWHNSQSMYEHGFCRNCLFQWTQKNVAACYKLYGDRW